MPIFVTPCILPSHTGFKNIFNQRGILSPPRRLVPCALNLKMLRRARNHFFWWQIICIDISKGWCCKDFQLTMKGHLKVSAVFLGNLLLKVSVKDSLEIFFSHLHESSPYKKHFYWIVVVQASELLYWTIKYSSRFLVKNGSKYCGIVNP